MWCALKGGSGGRSQNWKLDPERGQLSKHPSQLHGFEEKYRSCAFPGGEGRDPKSHKQHVNSKRNGEWWLSTQAVKSQRSLHLGARCSCGHSHSSRGWGQIQPGQGSPRLTSVSLCVTANTRCHSRHASLPAFLSEENPPHVQVLNSPS